MGSVGASSSRAKARLALAVVVAGAALAGALLLYGQRESYRTVCSFPPVGSGHRGGCIASRRPGWATPTALVVFVVGLAAATSTSARCGRTSRRRED